MFDGFRYTKTKDYITETEYENVDMIPCSAQTPRINQRIPGILKMHKPTSSRATRSA